MDNLEEVGLAAVDKFITTWNSRNAETWASSLNFPHVRPSPAGEISVADTPEAYVAAVDYNQVIKSGWDHSEWDYKHVMHTSPGKIHVAGQWSRYSAAGEVILTTPIVYICTNIDGEWGIQSRFAVDYVDEETDTSEMMSRSMNLIQDFANHYSAGAREACAELINFPHFSIGIGELNKTGTAEEFKPAPATLEIVSVVAAQTGKRAINMAVELTFESESGKQPAQGVINVNDRDGHLGIQAWSFLNPQSES